MRNGWRYLKAFSAVLLLPVILTGCSAAGGRAEGNEKGGWTLSLLKSSAAPMRISIQWPLVFGKCWRKSISITGIHALRQAQY